MEETTLFYAGVIAAAAFALLFTAILISVRPRTRLILMVVVPPVLACMWLFASEILNVLVPLLVMLILVGGPAALFVVPVAALTLIFYLIRNVGSNYNSQR